MSGSRRQALTPSAVIPGGAKHRTRNLEIPRCAIAHLRSGASHHPGMTAADLADLQRREMPLSSMSQNLERHIMSAPLQIGLLVFPKVTQLDLTGPVQVFSSVPGAKVHLIWKRVEPVASDSVLVLTPTITFADCPQLDVICVPGGFGVDDLLTDDEVLDFLRRQAERAKFVTSVCTGSLVLG